LPTTVVSGTLSGGGQPQRPGVRLGKCQARRKVTVTSRRVGIACVTAKELTGMAAPEEESSAPSSLKSSQKVTTPSQSRGRFHPRRYETLRSGTPTAHNANEPFKG